MKQRNWAQFFRYVGRINSLAISAVLLFVLGFLLLQLVRDLRPIRSPGNEIPREIIPAESPDMNLDLALSQFERVYGERFLRAELLENTGNGSRPGKFGYSSFADSIVRNVMYMDLNDSSSWWLHPDSGTRIAFYDELFYNGGEISELIGFFYRSESLNDPGNVTAYLVDREGRRRLEVASGQLVVDEIFITGRGEMNLIYHENFVYENVMIDLTTMEVLRREVVDFDFPPMEQVE